MSPAASVQFLQKAPSGLNIRLGQASGSEICISTLLVLLRITTKKSVQNYNMQVSFVSRLKILTGTSKSCTIA